MEYIGVWHTVKRGRSRLFLIMAVIVACCSGGFATAAEVPEPFRDSDPNSTYKINYDVLTDLLSSLVVDVGRSNRSAAESSEVVDEAGIAPLVAQPILTEGNRFYFEGFLENEKAHQIVKDIRNNLQSIPDKVPLEKLSRNEQLAYWLNLYNTTILNEIVAIYPEEYLEEFLTGDHGILSKKVLSVSGVSLSLNDIQYHILQQNYDNDPLVLYGLYKGIVGGPNIRLVAYSGSDVYRQLQDNATEFINSNRGTSASNQQANVLHVSSLYSRQSDWFPDFNSDLSEHLLAYLEAPLNDVLKTNPTLVADINDWSITDLYGTVPEIQSCIAPNQAGPLNVFGTTGGSVAMSSSPYTGRHRVKTLSKVKFSPDELIHLTAINTMRMDNMAKDKPIAVEESAVEENE